MGTITYPRWKPTAEIKSNLKGFKPLVAIPTTGLSHPFQSFTGALQTLHHSAYCLLLLVSIFPLTKLKLIFAVDFGF
jgi:hypothetical protein